MLPEIILMNKVLQRQLPIVVMHIGGVEYCTKEFQQSSVESLHNVIDLWNVRRFGDWFAPVVIKRRAEAGNEVLLCIVGDEESRSLDIVTNKAVKCDINSSPNFVAWRNRDCCGESSRNLNKGDNEVFSPAADIRHQAKRIRRYGFAAHVAVFRAAMGSTRLIGWHARRTRNLQLRWLW